MMLEHATHLRRREEPLPEPFWRAPTTPRTRAPHGLRDRTLEERLWDTQARDLGETTGKLTRFLVAVVATVTLVYKLTNSLNAVLPSPENPFGRFRGQSRGPPR